MTDQIRDVVTPPSRVLAAAGQGDLQRGHASARESGSDGAVASVWDYLVRQLGA